MAQSLFKSFSRNQLATKAQSFPRKSSNTTSPMIVHHTRDFTRNQGGSSNSPPPPQKTLIIKFPPPRDSKGVKCPWYVEASI